MSHLPGAKVVIGNETIIDLTGDNVGARKMLAGTTAHDRTGSAITGGIQLDDDTVEAAESLYADGLRFFLDEDGYICQEEEEEE